ncbi:hypothetical protein [Streptomyces lincolnensis]
MGHLWLRPDKDSAARRPALSALATEPDEVVRMTDVSGAIPAHPDTGQ